MIEGGSSPWMRRVSSRGKKSAPENMLMKAPVANVMPLRLFDVSSREVMRLKLGCQDPCMRIGWSGSPAYSVSIVNVSRPIREKIMKTAFMKLAVSILTASCAFGEP